jgi:tRNA/rRNA methyltransferase
MIFPVRRVAHTNSASFQERLDRFSFVLVRPKVAENVGAAARALKNMGFSDLRLVAPQSYSRSAAATLAVHAGDVLRGASVYPDLAQALKERTLTVGTTCRRGAFREHAQELRQSAMALAEAVRGNQIAVIFGPEDDGLSNQELKVCQQLIVIPTSAAYQSLNLAQAVMLVAYELTMALRNVDGSVGDEAAAELAALLTRAPVAEVEAMLRRLEQALTDIGFLPSDSPDRIMFVIRNILGRTGLTRRETDILNGIASQIRWFADEGHQTLAAKRRDGRKFR